MDHTFAVPRQRLRCACCSAPILTQDHKGGIHDLDYHRLHFTLSDLTVAPVSFCTECASHEWTPERLSALQYQCYEGWIAEGSPKQSWTHEGLRFLQLDPRYPVQTWAEVQ